ncbi:MAG: hypothetical protein WD275_03325, partial [Rhodothermales bacterium]
MSFSRCLRFLTLLLFLGVSPARSQDSPIVLFDEDDGEYRESSEGSATGGDFLELGGPGDDRLPLETIRASSGEVSGRLRYRHVEGGAWEMTVGVDNAPLDLRNADSLIIYLNSISPVPGTDLPLFSLVDGQGRRTAAHALSTGTLLGYNRTRSGFRTGSTSDVILEVSYVSTLPQTESRTGYPEDILITFSDDYVGTSAAAIGLPAVPTRYKVATTDGFELPFRFRDLDGDGTLGRKDEYTDILMNEPGSGSPRATWRLRVVQDAIAPPAAGDIFLLAVDNRGTDGDPE